jgi:hypothetical protein
MFKRVFNKGPREYRAAFQGDVAHKAADPRVLAGINTLQ